MRLRAGILVLAAALPLAAPAADATAQTPETSGRETNPLLLADHLVYAVPDLDSGAAQVERLLGVKPMVGGQHPGRGTRNALVGLGPAVYLEILAPDPAQPAPQKPRSFHLDEVKTPRLVGWGAHGRDVAAIFAEAKAKGVQLGEIGSGGRKRPDGVELKWTFTDPDALLGGGVVPFFIDWGSSPHPAKTAPQGATLVGMRAEHPDPASVERMLKVLGVDMPVTRGPAPALIAVIQCPKGRVELR
ncbi:MAG TPA: VOC family protein [Thermoanaerobaculia bacterium]|nr:VOC family protein [Thermoanaerobaculia bacterium]